MQKYELLLVAISGWFVAQCMKYILRLRKDGFQLSDLYASGDFPSTHTSSITSVTTLIGLRYGLDSPIFALAAVMSVLVMYDAVGVRRSSGEQAKAINELADKTGKKLITRLHGAKGHTPPEVIGGLAVGVVVALLFFWFN